MPFTIEAAAFLSACLQNWLDVGIILTLLFVNATLGFVEERNTQASMSVLKEGLVRKVPCRRDGRFTRVLVTELVPGDLISLRGGDIVPADAEWSSGDVLEVDQAALTGESLPVLVPRDRHGSSSGAAGEDHSAVAPGALWCGAVIKSGECHAIVTRTGMRTMMGEAAQAVRDEGGQRVGLFAQKIEQASQVLIVLTLLAICGLLALQLGWRRHQDVNRVVQMCISLLIAAVPVAMPLVLRVTLAVGAQRMAAEAAIVTHLSAMEEIATMDVLCADKTGTLTTGAMAVMVEKATCVSSRYNVEQLLTLAAIASNEASAEDAIDVAVAQAYAHHAAAEAGSGAWCDPAEALHRLREEYRTVRGHDLRLIANLSASDGL
jgi:H+-transporting ATPase